MDDNHPSGAAKQNIALRGVGRASRYNVVKSKPVACRRVYNREKEGRTLKENESDQFQAEFCAALGDTRMVS
jgi:hypothetical protein